jgi:hypothetical protein
LKKLQGRVRAAPSCSCSSSSSSSSSSSLFGSISSSVHEKEEEESIVSSDRVIVVTSYHTLRQVCSVYFMSVGHLFSCVYRAPVK